MVKIIETNLSINGNNEIMDHQSRVINCVSWGEYIASYLTYNGEAVYYPSENLHGNSINANCIITNFKYDDFHLSCDITSKHYTTKKLAYLI